MQHSTLFRQLDQLNDSLDGLGEQLAQYTNDQLNAAPSPGAWSVLQIVHHLALAERASLQYLQKKTRAAASQLAPVSWSRPLRMGILRLYMISPIKAKAPGIVATDKFPATSTLAAALADWRSARADITSFLQNLADEYADRAIYRHPLAGPVNVADMVTSFKWHAERHQRQIKRTLAVVAAH